MSTVQKKGHPSGLYMLFVTEMWERFSYYGMRALFILFMTKALLFDKELGAQIYGSYSGLVYLTPLIGGYVADRYWGNRKSIIVGGVLMALGQLFMFLSGAFYTNQSSLAPLLMFIGLGFLVFGNGFFKPNISSMVGQLYTKNDPRIDGAFTIFYMGINLGAFFAPLVCGSFGDTGDPNDFKWGFLCAAIGMILCIVLFVFLKDKHLVTPEGNPIGIAINTEKGHHQEQKTEKISTKQILIWSIVWGILLLAFYFGLKGEDGQKDLIGAFIFSLTIAAPGFIISDPSLSKVEKQRIWVIYIVAFFVIFFWSAFEQAGASLTYFAEEQTDRQMHIGFLNFDQIIPASYFQSVNSVAIVIFAPIFAVIWAFLGKRKLEPTSPTKQALGLFLLALGYLFIAFGVKGLQPGVKVSMLWLIGLYTIHTFGELCLSPIGLSMVNKLAPAKFVSLLMGVWFLSTATANKFAGTLSSFYPQEYVSVEKVKEIQEVNHVSIFDFAKPENNSTIKEINGVKSIPFDKVQLSSITNKKQKEEIKLSVEKLKVVNPKSFLGFKVDSLYSFFMLFVFMAGISSIILLFLSKKLVKMMHEEE